MPKSIPVKSGAWTKVAFGDVVRLSRERSADPAADSLERFIGLEHIEPGDLRVRRWGNVADGVTFTNIFRPGQVLFGKRRAYQRKVAVADFSGVCSSDIYVLEPKGTALLPELLPFICQTDAFFEHAVGTSAGSLSPRTNWESLSSFEFALPPIEEQRRVAYGLRCVETALEATAALGKSISCLETSCVDAWLNRLERGGVVQVPLAHLLQSPIFYGANAPAVEYSDALPRFIRITDIDERGRLRSESRASIEAQVDASSFVRPGDLLIARTGNTIGKTYLVDGSEGHAVFAGYLLCARPDPKKVLPRYLLALSRASSFKNWVKAKMRVGTQPNINAKEYSAYPVLLPRSVGQQEELCERLAQLSQCGMMCLDRTASARRLKSQLLGPLA